MKILVTGFEAFGGEKLNPTQALAEAVARGEIRAEGVELRSATLPVTYNDAFPALERAMHEFNPDIVLSFGQAGGRDAIEFERIAINRADSTQADNAGHVILDQPIEENGEIAYLSTLPLHKLTKILEDAGIKARISNSAGTYVCNALFYRLQQSLRLTTKRSGFIHVPYLPEQTSDKPSMDLATLKRALQLIVATISS